MKMAQDWIESTWVTISYGNFINQFPPGTVKSIRPLEKTYTKICTQNMSILFNGNIYIYIYIYIIKRAAGTYFPDFLSPIVAIIHRISI